MGKKKSFTTSGIAALTGESRVVETKETPAETVVEKKVEMKPVEKVAPAAPAEETVQETTTPAPKKASTNKRRTTAKKKTPGIQDPNKRSVKKSNRPVTLYLNSTNMDKLTEYAEQEQQKISWLIDELIYDFLRENLEE